MGTKQRTSKRKRSSKRKGGDQAVQAIQTINYRSWNEFKTKLLNELFGDGPFLRGKYLFRGHSDPYWALIPTFDRMFASQPKTARLRIADDLLSSFRRDIERLDLPGLDRENDSVVLALGQHYGLPTRLLDWTESPYVAAFFAFNSSVLWGTFDQAIAIWVLHIDNPIWSSEFGVAVVDVPTFANKRIRNQSGKFTLSKTPFPSLEQYVEGACR